MDPNEYSWKRPDPQPQPPRQEKPKRPPLRFKPVLIPLIAIVLVIASILFNSFYELQEDEFAVITTLGKPSVVSTSGLKFKWPFIQQKTLVSKATKGFAIGYDIRTGNSIPTESVMITVDYNFVNVDFYVEYRVTDPVKYLYNSADPVGILKMLCQSYIRDTIGLYKVDDVITTGKSEIQSAIKDKILARLEQEDLGITLVNITIQDAEPPTAKVQEAFKAVETAKQDAETATNNANKYANEVLPAAQADADEVLQKAEAYKTSRINEANGQASRFQKLYEEYKEAEDDSVVILGVAAPGFGNEKDREGIVSFLNENGYTYPVLMDETGEQFMNYYVFSYPTTFMIDRDGNVFGYVSGSLPEETMREIIRKTLAGEK